MHKILLVTVLLGKLYGFSQTVCQDAKFNNFKNKNPQQDQCHVVGFPLGFLDLASIKINMKGGTGEVHLLPFTSGLFTILKEKHKLKPSAQGLDFEFDIYELMNNNVEMKIAANYRLENKIDVYQKIPGCNFCYIFLTIRT